MHLWWFTSKYTRFCVHIVQIQWSNFFSSFLRLIIILQKTICMIVLPFTYCKLQVLTGVLLSSPFCNCFQAKTKKNIWPLYVFEFENAITAFLFSNSFEFFIILFWPKFGGERGIAPLPSKFLRPCIQSHVQI